MFLFLDKKQENKRYLELIVARIQSLIIITF
jgi:hypothetical protein